MKKNNVITNIILCLLFLNFGNLFSQSNCPPSLMEETWSDPITVYNEPYPFFPLGTVDVRYRNIGNRTEIKVDWNSFQRYNLPSYLTNEEAKSFMILAIIKEIVGNCSWQGNKEIAFYDEVECTITKNCYLRVDNQRSIYCKDEHWTGDDPEIILFNYISYWRFSQTFECGYTCCETVYQVYCEQNNSGIGIYKIASQSNNLAPGSQCQTNVFYDCLTGDPVNCISNCY